MSCAIEDCGRKAITRGWCDMHYRRWKDHGDPRWMRPTPTERVCAMDDCPATFMPAKLSDPKRFCSKRCEWLARGGAEFSAAVSRSTVEKRATTMRGRGEGRSYRKLGGRHEHRVVAERTLGRPLTRKEVVHHKDHNHLNNDPSNLEVMTQAEHMQRHGLGIPGMALTWKPWEHRRTKAS